jgi:AraC-like DNA-binding protein
MRNKHELQSGTAWPETRALVAALLPEASHEALTRILQGAHVVSARSWEEVDQVVRSHEILSIVMDPLIRGDDLTPAICLLKRFPRIPALAYVPLSPQYFRAVAKLGREGLYGVFLHPLPDSGRRLRKLLEQFRSETLPGRFFGNLEPWAGRLPPTAARAVVDLFDKPHRYKTAADLATQSHLSTRHLQRKFLALGGGTPRKLVIAAKILRACSYLREPCLSVEDISQKLGYETIRVLANHTGLIFGCCPSKLRKELDDEELLRQVLEWFYKPAPRAGCERRFLFSSFAVARPL